MSSRQKYSVITIESLPTEVLLHILSFLGIPDLVRLMMVSRHLRRLIQGARGARHNTLWAKASTEKIQVNNSTYINLKRAAQFGNKEALVKLIVAHLYCEGVPEGSGRGTVLAENGIEAAKLLISLETLPSTCQPFSWVLIRPPFSKTFLCCKACVCAQIKLFCTKYKRSEYANLFHVLGKVSSFCEEPELRKGYYLFFKIGSKLGSPYSSYEYWKAIHTIQSTLTSADVAAIRDLRQIANEPTAVNDARFELCRQYALGHYGGLSRPIALSYITQTMLTSPPLLADKVFRIQHKVNRYMMLVLVDWLVEVGEMKHYQSRTFHMAMQLIQRYLIKRSLTRPKIQLLGVTALLIASRWYNHTILTIREAACITDDTYTYEEVVNMIADLIAALEGDLIHPLPTDYLEILIPFTSSDERIGHLASYIAETCVINLEFGGLSTAHFSAACLLLSQILLRQEFPWSSDLVEVTGLKLANLKDTVLQLYNTCYVGECLLDYRGEKLNAIHSRYAADQYNRVSEIQVMGLSELNECLGVTPPSSTRPSPHKRKLSFSSQSCPSSDDSLVTQSFIQEFHSHFISDPSSSGTSPEPSGVSPPVVHQSSPLPDLDPAISFNFPSDPSMEDSSVESSISSEGDSLSCSEERNDSSDSSSISSSNEGSSSVSSPPVSGVVSLHSEDTMGYNKTTRQQNSSVRKNTVKQSKSREKENVGKTNSIKSSKLKTEGHQQQVVYSRTGAGKPLGKLNTNQCLLESNCKRKRRRSS